MFISLTNEEFILQVSSNERSFRIIDNLLRKKCNKENLLHYHRKFPLIDNSHSNQYPVRWPRLLWKSHIGQRWKQNIVLSWLKSNSLCSNHVLVYLFIYSFVHCHSGKLGLYQWATLCIDLIFILKVCKVLYRICKTQNIFEHRI